MIRAFLLTSTLFVSLFFVNPLYAEDDNDEADITISNIIIVGNNRVTNSTILSYADVAKGDLFNSSLVQNVIKNLYNTNYFDDISVTVRFNDLIIKVKEKPIISEIILTDNAIIEDEDILSALDSVGISRTSPYDKNIFDKTEQELVRLYFDRGRYKYHGRIKVFAEALRKEGLTF